MKVSELIEELTKCPSDAEEWLPNVNNLNIQGYCVLDHVMKFKFAKVESDVMDNPGEIDHRLLKDKTDDTHIVYLGSKYELIRE